MCILKDLWREQAEFKASASVLGMGKKVQAVVCLQRIVPQFSLGKAILCRPSWPACASMDLKVTPIQFICKYPMSFFLLAYPSLQYNTTRWIALLIVGSVSSKAAAVSSKAAVTPHRLLRCLNF